MQQNIFIPQCESPVFLINHSALNLIYNGGQLYLNNMPSNIITKDNINSFPKGGIFKMVEHKPIEQIETFFVLRGDTKEFLFTFAPCGHCAVCREKKQMDIVWRAALESSLYSCPPVFFTLTYSSKYLPRNSELQYTDVQKFFKRLRIRWDRQNLKHNIRYLVSGEYGSKSILHRPHYHVILWNNPYNASEFQPVEFNKLRDDIFFAWGMSEPQAFDFGQCAGGAAAYCAKYVSKESKSFGHFKKPFIRSSCGSGGIGFPHIKNNINYYRQFPWLSSYTFTAADGSTQSINFGQYLSRKIYPSPTSLIPWKHRQAYKELSDLLHLSASIGLYSISEVRDILDKLRPFPSVTKSRFDIKLIHNIKCCSTYKRYIYPRLIRAIDYNIDILSEYTDIDKTYYTQYLAHKSYNNDEKFVYQSANRALRHKDKEKIQYLKEKL